MSVSPGRSIDAASPREVSDVLLGVHGGVHGGWAVVLGGVVAIVGKVCEWGEVQVGEGEAHAFLASRFGALPFPSLPLRLYRVPLPSALSPFQTDPLSSFYRIEYTIHTPPGQADTPAPFWNILDRVRQDKKV